MKQGLILLMAVAAALACGAGEPPMKISVLDNAVLCVRASQLPGTVADAIRAAGVPGHLAGMVLDLRFADGAATNAADYFIRKRMPLVVLVNSLTRGPALALAAQLRADAAAVLIGSTNSPASLTPDIVVAVGAEEEKNSRRIPF